jgi:hypothetical protein
LGVSIKAQNAARPDKSDALAESGVEAVFGESIARALAQARAGQTLSNFALSLQLSDEFEEKLD